ncbi:MAG: hypothetical protein ACRC7V_09910 [Lachnospiraceae bacterium]
MISKNLCYLKKNELLKQASWVMGSVFVLTLFYPLFLSIELNNIRMQYALEAMQQVELEQRALNMMQGYNTLQLFLVALCAILVAIQSFAYIHNKVQVDFFHCQPVSTKKRFFTRYKNGILCFTVPFFMNTLLGIIVVAANNAFTASYLRAFTINMVLTILFFLAIYHITLFAIMLTGNTLISLLGTCVFLGYEWLVRSMILWMSMEFFHTYFESHEEYTLFSPIVTLTSYYVNETSIEKTCIKLALYSILFLVFSYGLYTKRSAFACGKALAFSATKRIIKLCIMIPVSLCGSLFLYSTAGKSIVFGIVGAILTILILHVMFQCIFEFDFRSSLLQKKDILIVGGAVGIIYLIFVFDLVGYDSYLPKLEKLDQVSYYVDNRYIYNNYIEKDGTEKQPSKKMLESLHVTDYDLLNEVLEEYVIRDKVDRSLENSKKYISIFVCFQKNDKKTYRMYTMDQDNAIAVIDKLTQTKEYIELQYQVLDKEFIETYKISNVEYYNGYNTIQIAEENFNKIREAYEKDVRLHPYSDMLESNIIGTINFYGVSLKGISNYKNVWQCEVYENYANTRKALEELEIEIQGLLAQEIESITITNYNLEASGGAYYSEYEITKVYQDTKEIEAIFPYLVKEDWTYTGYITQQRKIGYDIIVKRKESEMIYYYCFVEDRIPSFVIEDTRY